MIWLSGQLKKEASSLAKHRILAGSTLSGLNSAIIITGGTTNNTLNYQLALFCTIHSNGIKIAKIANLSKQPMIYELKYLHIYP
jgi:hypothetical protein